MEPKYRIIYNNETVLVATEDIGTTFIGTDSGHMIMVDTIENANTMLRAIGVDTTELYNF